MAQRITKHVQNQSSREGVRPDTILMHTTQGHNREGVSDLLSLWGWFNNPASDASSHLGIDQEGNRIRMVSDDRKAWTSGRSWNARSLNIELVGFAEWDRKFWKAQYRKGLNEAAKAVAEWSIKYDIPLVKRAPNGVAGHVDISGPGGHWDPGKGFPWKVFLLMAKLHKRRLLKRKNTKINRSMRARIMRALRG